MGRARTSAVHGVGKDFGHACCWFYLLEIVRALCWECVSTWVIAVALYLSSAQIIQQLPCYARVIYTLGQSVGNIDTR